MLADALKNPKQKSGDISATDLGNESEMLSPMLPENTNS